MATKNEIRCGTALTLIMRLQSIVDLIMTSPPWPGRQGGPHPDDYVAWFLPYVRQFMRVLKPGGSLVLNIKEPVVDGERIPAF